ncbi:Retrovirus-related Pol polyprotein from transposon TNT 1-94 [Sesamum angolense]|uniref:Retrovirus-related Pol polyprotein from transposon TNT 1-94 n=1 Tax=Sesamum angolense TaxID=2727404 RepID=A0AAE2C7H3_9LAMI|nr:Retrovirus-related Pol polyprotein from transposon TNT 1-94 [Sesamum angolense]
MTVQHEQKFNNHENAQLWHAKLGHISKDRIRKLVDSKSLEIDDFDNLQTCESCLKGKITEKPFVGQSAISNSLLDLIHIDVCEPLNNPARGGYSYFITFTDDHSRYGYVYLMRYKSETSGRFTKYRLEVENQTGHQIKALWSDRGGEYLSVKLLNMAPSKMVPQMLYGVWHDKRASYKYLGVWGSPAYVKRLVGDKLDLRLNIYLDNDPRTYGEEMSNINPDKSLEDMTSEMDSMGSNQVWTLVDPPKGARPVGCKWVYKRKLGAEREINWRVSLSLEKNRRFVVSKSPSITSNKVPEAGTRILMNSYEDMISSRMGMILVYTIRSVGARLHTLRFMSMTSCSLETTSRFLKRFKMKNSKRGHNSIRHGIKLSKKQSPEADEELKRMLDIPYASSVESIQYVVQCTKPDVAYALSVTSRYQA